MERGIFHTPLGGLGMVAAAVTDVLAWVLLAVVVAAARNGSPASIIRTCLLIGLFGAGMWLVARRVVTAAFAEQGGWLPEGGGLAVIVIGVLLSAAATEALGIHLIFGAFLFGAACPRGVPALDQARDKIADVTAALLLPPFFAIVGIRTQVAQLGSRPVVWLWLGVFLVLAVAGKWGATALAGRGMGLDGWSAVRLGVLLNCKGLTELVMLGVGLDLGLLSDELFTLLVLVTLATTTMTVPLLALLDRLDGSRWRRAAVSDLEVAVSDREAADVLPD
jgi:Kef-type K+ transport system membrane component KefB